MLGFLLSWLGVGLLVAAFVPEDCDPIALKEPAEKHGLQISGLAYVGGGLHGREIAFGYHNWLVDKPEHFTRCGFSSVDSEEREEEFRQMKHAIDLAAHFGTRTVRVVPGDDRAESIETLVPWFKRSAEHAAEKSVFLCFEIHGNGIAGMPELCIERSEKAGSPISVSFLNRVI